MREPHVSLVCEVLLQVFEGRLDEMVDLILMPETNER